MGPELTHMMRPAAAARGSAAQVIIGVGQGQPAVISPGGDLSWIDTCGSIPVWERNLVGPNGRPRLMWPRS
jgi:hypothetical protein